MKLYPYSLVITSFSSHFSLLPLSTKRPGNKRNEKERKKEEGSITKIIKLSQSAPYSSSRRSNPLKNELLVQPSKDMREGFNVKPSEPVLPFLFSCLSRNSFHSNNFHSSLAQNFLYPSFLKIYLYCFTPKSPHKLTVTSL